MLRLGTWEGSLEALGSFTRSDTETGGERSRSEGRHTEERLNVKNTNASIYDPRLVTFSLGASFGLFQDRFTFDGERASNTGTLLDYDAFASVLSTQPLSLTLFANRNESSLSRELAGQSEIVTENRGVTLFARGLYIPSTLAFRQESSDEETRVGNVVARRNDERRIVTYRGQRGWLDSEMEALYEFIDDVDRVFPQLSFRSHEAQLTYSLDFGEELNRRWDSRLRYFTRTGIIESTVMTADESLHLRHTDTLHSDYRYFFVRTEIPGGTTTTHTALASLQHRLYESLVSTASVDALHENLPQGEKDAYRGRLEFAYTKGLPLGGRLTADVGGSLRYEDDRFQDTEASVVQESHTAASPLALPIPLANPFVVTASVVVVKVSLGPPPIGCVPPPGPPTPLVVDQDFTLRTINDVTEIVPIPCAGTTVGINPGDTIVVDYRFSVSPSLAFTTTVWHANASLDYRWVRLFVAHDQTDQNLVRGQDDRFLDNRRSDTVGAELRYDGFRLRASLLGEARRYTSRRVSYDSLHAGALADVSILQGLSLRLTGDEVVTRFREQKRETTSQVARAALIYTPSTGLFVDASAGVRRLEDTLQPTERLAEARLVVRWFVRKLEISPSLEFFDRQRGDTSTREYRALLRTIRRF